MEKALEKVKKLQGEMDDCLIERSAQIEALLAALIASTHVLLLGPPGTAKSLLAKMVCNAIDGAEYFKRLLTKFSLPEEIFGPFSMTSLKTDVYKRIITRKLPEAHIAFIDEIFKGNSAILNSLLTCLEEREFDNDGEDSSIPLITCVGASNELPQGEELGALYDRFLVKFWVSYIEDDDAWCDLLEGKKGNGSPKTKITLDEIKELQNAVDTVTINRETTVSMREIHRSLEREGITASDRRWKAAVKVMKAYALLRGQTEVTNDELEVLADILWHKPEDRKVVYGVVAPKANPLNMKALEYLDAAKDAYTTWGKKSTATEDAQAKQMESLQANGVFNEIVGNINSDIACAEPTKTKKLKDALNTIKRYQKEVVSSLGI